jgi:tetrapyrrole methylase family protein/MazG family protein
MQAVARLNRAEKSMIMARTTVIDLSRPRSSGDQQAMSKRFDDLVQLMAKLRAPDGCPWHRKQTHESLKPYLIEEAYEVLESIDQNDPATLGEELGDLFLQVLFHGQIGAEQGTFTLEQIMQSLTDKLIRRHPHVFGTLEQKAGALNPEEVKVRWEQIKRDERAGTGQRGSALDGVPKTLPALLRAYQVQARASRVGFDWPGIEPVLQKLEEELQELRDAMAVPSIPTSSESHETSRTEIEAELGDVLFTLVNVARFLKVNPEEALRKTITRFSHRFEFIEAQATASGRTLEDMTLTEMDALWEEAKDKTLD